MSSATTTDVSADRAFMELVERELRGDVTDQERAYLGGTPDALERWYAALQAILNKAQTILDKKKTALSAAEQEFLAYGNGPAEQADWLRYKAEQEESMCRSRAFVRLMHTRVAYLNQQRKQALRKQEYEERKQEYEEEHIYRWRTGYCMGWTTALDTLQALTQVHGIPLMEALVMAHKHTAALTTWRDNCHLDGPAPVVAGGLTRPAHIAEMAYCE